MPTSFRNILNANAITDALIAGDSQTSLKSLLKKGNVNSAKYIKGYVQSSAIEELANSLNINKELTRQFLGIEKKELDLYDPYHVTDSKKEEFWYSTTDPNLPNTEEKLTGEQVQKSYDEDTNTFKRSLYSTSDYRQNDFWYEDPFVPSFELFFDENSPLFNDDPTKINSLAYFLSKYTNEVDPIGYSAREELWNEFKKIFFKIFEKGLRENKNRNLKNKSYYITKIAGLQNLNKKIINYAPDGDKLTITINEDVSMIAWYISELYKNLIYSYKNQRYAFPDNVLRFDLTIKINDMRNYSIPQSKNMSSDTVPVDKNYLDNFTIKNVISPKSQIVYTLHDCNFNFFDSRNYGDDLEIGGYSSAQSYTPQTLTFDIFYKSVTRWSEFPLINQSLSMNAWEPELWSTETGVDNKQNYFNNLDRIQSESAPEKKSFLNNLLKKGTQTIVNQGLNYMDNLETKLRETRGSVVNDIFRQFSNSTIINKIEPDNIYNSDFNNRVSVSNLGKQIGAGLLSDLEGAVKGGANF